MWITLLASSLRQVFLITLRDSLDAEPGPGKEIYLHLQLSVLCTLCRHVSMYVCVCLNVCILAYSVSVCVGCIHVCLQLCEGCVYMCVCAPLWCLCVHVPLCSVCLCLCVCHGRAVYMHIHCH